MEKQPSHDVGLMSLPLPIYTEINVISNYQQLDFSLKANPPWLLHVRGTDNTDTGYTSNFFSRITAAKVKIKSLRRLCAHFTPSLYQRPFPRVLRATKGWFSPATESESES